MKVSFSTYSLGAASAWMRWEPSKSSISDKSAWITATSYVPVAASRRAWSERPTVTTSKLLCERTAAATADCCSLSCATSRMRAMAKLAGSGRAQTYLASGLGQTRHRETELRPSPDRASGPQIATHADNQPAAEGQPQSAASRFLRLVFTLIEILE